MPAAPAAPSAGGHACLAPSPVPVDWTGPTPGAWQAVQGLIPPPTASTHPIFGWAASGQDAHNRRLEHWTRRERTATPCPHPRPLSTRGTTVARGKRLRPGHGAHFRAEWVTTTRCRGHATGGPRGGTFLLRVLLHEEHRVSRGTGRTPPTQGAPTQGAPTQGALMQQLAALEVASLRWLSVAPGRVRARPGRGPL